MFRPVAAIVLVLAALPIPAQRVDVRIPFRAVVGESETFCGMSYAGVGTTHAAIRLKDLRFYVHDVRLLDDRGREVALELEQSPWQFEDAALLDFEDGSGGCSNGTPERNAVVTGTAPSGAYRGLRFKVGLPFSLNHSDLTSAPAPLNLSALVWGWNAGRKFARIEIATGSRPQGVIFHLGSTGCQPGDRSSTPPVSCKHPNRAEVDLPAFDPASSVVVADLAALFRDVDLTRFTGCMSSRDEPDCGPIFQSLGLPWEPAPGRGQSFFRTGR